MIRVHSACDILVKAYRTVSRTVGPLSGTHSTLAHGVFALRNRIATNEDPDASFKRDQYLYPAPYPLPIAIRLHIFIQPPGHMEDYARLREGTRTCSRGTESVPEIVLRAVRNGR